MSERGHEHGYSLSLACQSGTDASHVIGNVTAVMLQFMLDRFPLDTFKTAQASTRLAHKQLAHTPNQIRTQPYPIMVVEPRISLSGIDNRMAAGSFATSLWSTTSNRFSDRSEMPVLLNDTTLDRRKNSGTPRGILWRGKINRPVCHFQFCLSFRSSVEQLNWASYLINKIPTDGYHFDVETLLEVAIPTEFLEETARYVGIPIKDENGSVSDFLNYLNTHSEFPISYRFSSGRHEDAFYMNYMTSMLCNIENFAYQNKRKNKYVETECPITFTIRCEFNTIGMWDLCVPNPKPVMARERIPGSICIPIFSDIVNDRDFPLKPGWKIHSKPMIQLDWGETEVDISSIISSSMSEMIDFHLKHGMDPGSFISIRMRLDRCVLEDGYYVDWKRRVLVLDNIDHTRTYRMIIAVNQLYINATLKQLYYKSDNI
jgi:hypothetical protein